MTYILPTPKLVCTSVAWCVGIKAILIYIKASDGYLINETTGHLEIKRANDWGPPIFFDKYKPYFEREHSVILGLDDLSKYWMAFNDEAEAAIFKLTHL